MRKQFWVVSALLLTLTMSLQAQQSDATVTVTSNPSGCSVILYGDMTVAGITPTTFSQKLQGFYRVTAHLDGYETYRSEIILPGRGATDINIALTPKTRVKAGIRSLVIPGWGQTYSGSKTKGVLLTLATLATAATTGILHLDYAGKRDDYEEVLERYRATREVAKRESLLDELYEAQKEANDAENARNVGFAVLAGVWAYNVLDAVLFFPDYGIKVSGARIGLKSGVSSDGVKLVGELKF